MPEVTVMVVTDAEPKLPKGREKMRVLTPSVNKVTQVPHVKLAPSAEVTHWPAPLQLRD